jgi:NADH-quinone oxidoreductase subunit G
VVDLCPVGALCSKDFLYEQRVWWLKSTHSVCPNCSTGCSVEVDQNEDTVYRLTPRTNPQAQGHFMCDEGRFGWKYIHRDDRLSYPEQRSGGQVVSRGWDDILPALRGALKKHAQENPKRIAAVLSPWMTVEEAYLLASYLAKLSPKVKLALGPAPIVGEDDRYPKDVHGQPAEPTRFTIRAEKCPNRRGVDIIVKNFTQSPATFDELLEKARTGELDVLYLVGGDPAGWIGEEQAAGLESLPLLVVQDILPSAASRRASFVLSGGSFAERDGTLVNHAGLAQEVRRSIRSPDGARPDNRILWELTGRTGLFNGVQLRQEIAKKIPEFAALAAGKLGDHGVWLTTSNHPMPVKAPAGARD